MFCLTLKQLKSALIMEAVGTMLFVFISAGAVVSSGNVAFWEMSPARLASISLAAGFGYAGVLYMTQTMSKDSVGFCNPAIALAIGLFGSNRYGKVMGIIRALLFVVFQVGGGIGGAVLIHFCIPEARGECTAKQIVKGTCQDPLHGAPQQAYATTVKQAIVFEAVGAFFLTWIVMHTTSPLRSVHSRNASAPIAAGLALAALKMCAFPYTGGSFNPAEAAATYAASYVMTKGSLAYVIGPPAGALLAGWCYWFSFHSVIRHTGVGAKPIAEAQAADDVYGDSDDESKTKST